MVRVLSMKLPHYDDYKESDTERCEQSLLTVWAFLRDFSEHLVLIGGLVPRYLCRTRPGGLSAQTLDVDLGIALAADGAHYDPISTRLRSHGFEPESNTGRFVRSSAAGSLIIDFLTEKRSEDDPDSRMVDDVRAQTVLGLDRALAAPRIVAVSGLDLQGARVTERVRVCEAGPFLCLKLAAYANRAEGKDVFDVVRLALDYDRGLDASVAAFRAERDINGAFSKAEAVLNERFDSPEAKGPVDYANFCLAGLRSVLGLEDYDRLLQERRNEAWLLGQRLAKRT